MAGFLFSTMSCVSENWSVFPRHLVTCRVAENLQEKVNFSFICKMLAWAEYVGIGSMLCMLKYLALKLNALSP